MKPNPSETSPGATQTDQVYQAPHDAAQEDHCEAWLQAALGERSKLVEEQATVCPEGCKAGQWAWEECDEGCAPFVGR